MCSLRRIDFIGQEQLLSDLWSALARGRVGHAYLFVGPEGVGRETLARLFGRALLCEAPAADRPCGECRSCLLALAGTHPDFQILAPDGATVKIGQMRELRLLVALKPVFGEHRVFLLAEMDRMSEAAANSFLLTLEDPPPGVVFIGWARAGEPVLPTIISRCQVARLNPMAPPSLAAVLAARGVDRTAADRIAHEARGLPGLAQKILASGDEQAAVDELGEQLLRADLLELFRLAESLAKEGREAVLQRLLITVRRLRGACIARATGDTCEGLPTGLPPNSLWRLQRYAAASVEFLKVNANTRLVLENLSLAFYRERTESFI